MDELRISSGFIEGVASAITAAAAGIHLPAAATTSGVDGLESAQAISALTESTRERIQRTKLNAAAFAALSQSTQLVADKMSETDRDLARSAESR
jgi:hypothetical protein